MYNSGYFSGAMYSFDRSAQSGWAFRGLSFPSAPSGGSTTFEASPGCFDSSTGIFYGIQKTSTYDTAQNIWSLNSNDWTLTNYSQANLSNAHLEWAIVVPEDRYLLAVGNPNGASPYWRIVDLADIEAGWYTPSYSTAYPETMGYGTYGVYHAASKSVYAWNDSGSTIYQLPMPPDGDYRGWKFAWQAVPATGGMSPPSVGNGPYSKFNIVQDMGDGNSALILMTTESDGRVFIYKLPSGSSVIS
jgi:hypothetical protein